MTISTQLAEQTKVWVYQSTPPFNDAAIASIREKIRAFADEWVSHDKKLRAYGDVFYDRFIVLMVDETESGASGCSIDTSVRFLKNLGNTLGVDLFDRMNFSYKTEDGIKSAHREEFMDLYRMGIITDETIVFDNLVSNKADFDSRWETPLGKSWHKGLITA